MELKEREQVVKDLQEIVDNYSGSWKRFNVLDNALVLIKELTEENEKLNERLGREAKCQYDLATKIVNLRDDVKYIKEETVRKMQKRLEERIDQAIQVFDFQISECNAIRQALRGVKNDIYQITKEMLEENNV